MLIGNCYSQDTQKQLFLSHGAMLDVYVNILQAAESAESSSAAIHGDSEDVHAIRNNSRCNRENSSIMVQINCRIDQGTCNHLRGESIARAAFPHVICICGPIAKQRTANVMIVVIWDILQSIASDVKASQID
uniref:Uncharacterized protein n=1 Tax=Romanomermis culicivorax TaxID=13658 RepID=A0A915I3B2_ROMCU